MGETTEVGMIINGEYIAWDNYLKSLVELYTLVDTNEWIIN